MIRSALAIALAVFCCHASAQAVTTIKLNGRPTVQADAAGTKSCGVRITGVSANVAEKDPIAETIESWIVVDRDGFAYFEVGHTVGKLSGGFERMKPTGKRPLWIRADGQKPMTPIGDKVVPGDAPGTFLFAVGGREAMAFLQSVLDSKDVWIALDAEKGRGKVFSGPVALEAQEMRQLVSCFSDLAKK
jgi:hypothetical protein